MAHVTIDHSPAAWVVNGPMIKVSIFCVHVCGLEVIVIPTWCKANWSTAAACGCFPKKNTLFFWDKKERWTNALFLFSVVSKYVPLKMLFIFVSVSEASLSSLLITPLPSPGSSLTGSCASSYQRRWLRSQTTSLENGVFPRWWDLDTSVLTQCEIKLSISNISIKKVQQTGLNLSVRDILYFQGRIQQCLSSWFYLFFFPFLARASPMLL